MVIVSLLNKEIAPGVTLRELAWRLVRANAYRPPLNEADFMHLRKLQIAVAEEVARGLSRIIPRMPFAAGNRKVGRIWTFDLLPIVTCPFATFCGKPGPQGLYRGPGQVCYDLNTARYSRQHLLREYLNYIHLMRMGYEWLRGWTRFIVEFGGGSIVRLHVGGDIFTQWYWEYIKRLAEEFPHVIFYLYTRSFPIVASSPDRPRNLVVLMSLDAANYHMLEKYGDYFDHVTYLLAGDIMTPQLAIIERIARWAEARGKKLIVFLEHNKRRRLLTAARRLSNYICPQEAGLDITCEKCRICFTRNI